MRGGAFHTCAPCITCEMLGALLGCGLFVCACVCLSAQCTPELAPCPLVSCRLRDVTGFLADRKYHLTTYKRCFVGNEFVDWLVANSEVSDREEGVELGRQLLESGTIRHGQ